MKLRGVTRRRSSMFWLIVLSYIAFVSLGLPDGLLGVAWPRMRAHFSQPLDALGMLLVFMTAGYMISSFLNGALVRKIGIGGLLGGSSVATAAALLGYTLVPAWWMVVALGLLAGLGAGAIDAGLNNYVEANFGAGLMQGLHASFGIGVTAGPFIMTFGLSNLDSWRFGYVVVATIQAVLALGFFLSSSLWNRGSDGTEVSAEEDQARTFSENSPADTIHAPHAELEPARGSGIVRGGVDSASMADSLRTPRCWLSALLFFVYTGIELSLGYWAYTLLTESRGVAPEVAGAWTGSYWATFTVGRILAGLYADRIGPARVVQLSLGGAAVGAVLVWVNLSPATSLAGIALVGFAIAPIFAAMVSTTSQRVGPAHTENTIGMQMAFAGLGVAVLPSLAGVIARRLSIEIVPPFLLVLVVTLLVLFRVAISRSAR